METKDYVVTKIEGEYAYLKEINGQGDEVFVALFLLPMGIDVGTKLRCEMLQYSIIE
jgi:hypothetical protein